MKAITLWQPYATWIAMGWKTIETRDHERFRSLVGKRTAIHAGMYVDREALKMGAFLARMRTRDHLCLNMLALQNFLTLMMLHRGKIACTAVIEHMVRAVGQRGDWSQLAMCDVAGKVCYFLKDIQPLANPVQVKGGRGIFNVPDEMIIHPVNPVNPV